MQTDDWRDWRVEHAGLTWRVATPDDVGEGSQTENVLATIAARYGLQDKPDLMKPPVILTLVAENADGVIIDGLYIELVAEIVKWGTDRAAFAAFSLLAPHIGAFLAERGVRVAQMNVSLRRTEAMRPSLTAMGFVRSDLDFSRWTRKVRD